MKTYLNPDAIKDGSIVKEKLAFEIGESTGGGNGIQALEVRYNWDGSELSDEDKAVNAATYAKVVAGGEYVIYTTSGGGELFAVNQLMPTEDYPAITAIFNFDAFTHTGQPPVQIVEISESGDVRIMGILNALLHFTFANISSYQDLYDGLVAGGIIPEMYPVQSILNVVLDSLTLENGKQFGGLAYIYLAAGVINISIEDAVNIYAFGNTGLYVQVLNPKVSLDDPDNIKYDNKYLFGSNTSLSTFNATIYYGEDRYTPISWKTTSIVTDGKVNLAVQFVIYRNGVYETWQVMDDGTTQQITS